MPFLRTPRQLLGAVAAQTDAVLGLPGAVLGLPGAVLGLPGAVLGLPGAVLALTQQIRSLADSMATVQRVAARAEALLDELEPGIKRVSRALDDPVIDEIPETLRDIQAQVVPMLRSFRDTQGKITAIADSTTRLASLPGAALFGAFRPRLPEPPSAD